jgi:hypothetical protein
VALADLAQPGLSNMPREELSNAIEYVRQKYPGCTIRILKKGSRIEWNGEVIGEGTGTYTAWLDAYRRLQEPPIAHGLNGK